MFPERDDDPRGACPDEAAIGAFLGRTRPAEQLASVERHLTRCSPCRTLIANLIRTGPPSDAPPRELTEGEVIGRYMVLEELGRGAMGVVYAAYDRELGRKVALKLLRKVAAPGEADKRLLREAKSLARVRHPNVVAVHDVGQVDGQVFLAMEHVEGTDLARWLTQKPRPWRAVLSVFLQAGRGLAAAHAAGLVHRDFKPNNVLIDEATEDVRVGDFGLARDTAAEGLEPESPTLLQEVPEVRTQTGAVLGTPAYMAPEQRQGHAVAEAADQFSFCVALYEALYGARPDTALAASAYQLHASSFALPTEERRAGVPRSIRRALSRGLSVQPSDRHPSMTALLAKLSKPSMRWRATAVAFALAGLAGAGVLGARVSHRAGPLCNGAAARLGGVWDGDRRQQVRGVLLRSKQLNADQAWQTTERILDRYAASWVDAANDACAAARIRGDQSEEVFSLRMDCLERRRLELKTLTQLLGAADETLARGAPKAASALGAMEGCADLLALRSAHPSPQSASVQREVAQLDQLVAEAKVRSTSGEAERAVPLLTAGLARARESKYRPIEAELLYELARAQTLSNHRAEGHVSYIEAARVAEAARLPALRAAVLTAHAYVTGFTEKRYADAYELFRSAEAVVESAGNPPTMLAELHWRRAFVLSNEGRAQNAWDELALLPADLPASARTLQVRGIVLQALGRLEEAAAEWQRAITLKESRDGNAVADLAYFHHGKALALAGLGRTSEALREIQRGQEVVARTTGPSSDAAALLLTLSSAILVDASRDHEAEVEADARAAIAIYEKILGPRVMQLLPPLNNLALVLSRNHRNAEARTVATRALELARSVGLESEDTADVLLMMAEVELVDGHLGAADTLGMQALKLHELLGGPRGRAAYPDLETLARIRLRQGRPAEAEAMLARAASLDGLKPRERSLAELRQAKLLWSRAADRSRAIALAQGALASLHSSAMPIDAEDLEKGRRWLRERTAQ